MLVLLPLVLAAQATLADYAGLAQMVQQKLQTSVEMINCDNVMNQFCPNPVPPPVVVFPSDSGSVSGSTLSCCKGNYLQCQVQLRTPLCRTLQTYTITPGQGNFEDVCPPTTPECTCQQALSGEKFLKLKFCPTTPQCCPICECHGDPHCSPFDQNIKPTIWAVCDDRDASCTHQASTCAQTSYAGQQCVWTKVSGSYAECLRAPGTPEPVMKMYSKTYNNYWNPADVKLYEFKLTLALTSYGAIGRIIVEDAGSINVFPVGTNGKCQGTPSYPLNSQGIVVINNLPSGVWMQFTCVNNGPNNPQRWDVKFVKDPWFVPSQLTTNTFGGFCATGVIAENQGDVNNGCVTMDKQISMYYGCNVNTPMATCKSQFCNQYANQMIYPGYSGTPVKQCTAYLSDPEQPNAFLYAACALNFLGSKPVNPQTCLQNQDCEQCANDITDYPDLIATILGAPATVPTSAPTSKCPPDLLSVGLNRKKLSSINSGIQVEFNTGNDQWQSVFALLDEEITACGGCNNIINVNGSASAANNALLSPGQYRIKQCTGYDSDPTQPLCDGALGYNATVWYNNPLSGGAVSTPYGALFDAGALVCSSTMFPKCPVNYQCCVWDKKMQSSAWNACMEVYHGGAGSYPSCGN